MFSHTSHLSKHVSYRYHIELVKLLADCTIGKNVYTEIKCHSLLPLDDIVAMVSHPDCIPEVIVSHEHCFRVVKKINKF
jgi:inositol 1,4,5-triphosphate receptor type 1